MIRKFPLNDRDYRAIIRVMDEQEEPLTEDERIALEKVKRIMNRISAGKKRSVAA